MANPVTGIDVGREVLAALGLTGQPVRSVTIRIAADELVTYTADVVSDASTVERVVRIIGEADGMISEGRDRCGIPAGRIADLDARARAGHLTPGESLALAVIRGDETAIGPLIDAAIEEFGHGGYRVPVRVVGDRKRMRVVIRTPDGMRVSRASADHMGSYVRRWIEGDMPVCVLDAGISLDVYEIGDGVTAEVEVNEE